MTDVGHDSAEPRFFSSSQRVALYLAANGRCMSCEELLSPGWHADHVIPYVEGGPTDVANGQALCPDCNLKKGKKVGMADIFEPRTFQKDLVSVLFQRWQAGKRVTTAVAFPGTGKTLAYQFAATKVFREGLAEHISVYVPRLTLAEQCEVDWKNTKGGGNWRLFDEPRLEKITHRTNGMVPFTTAEEVRSGFVTTYASLGSEPNLHLDWAQKHSGRFLLVADEAQFCGDDDDVAGGGTIAGDMIKVLSQFAAHTLLLTGTSQRSDRTDIVLAEYREDASGRRFIEKDVEASYADGIADGYLRPFEASLRDAKLRKVNLETRELEPEEDLSKADKSLLSQTLRRPEVWQLIVDDVVTRLDWLKSVHPGHQALLACMEQSDAKNVLSYLEKTYPHLRSVISVSGDGKAAEKVLREFKGGSADILVTVRKAFIGYDCKSISVVGVLTNYRDLGHLTQLVGRGFRAWDKVPYRDQIVHIVAPDDPRMQSFIEYLQEEKEKGFLRREEGSGPPPGEASFLLDSAWGTTTRVVGLEGDLDSDRTAIYEQFLKQHGPIQTPAQLQQFQEYLGQSPLGRTPPSRSTVTHEAPRTEKDEIASLKSAAMKRARRFVWKMNSKASEDEYAATLSAFLTQVNREQRIRSSSEIRTFAQAQERLAIVMRLTGGEQP